MLISLDKFVELHLKYVAPNNSNLYHDRPDEFIQYVRDIEKQYFDDLLDLNQANTNQVRLEDYKS